MKIIPVFLFMLVLEVVRPLCSHKQNTKLTLLLFQFVTTTLYAAAATARKLNSRHEHFHFVM